MAESDSSQSPLETAADVASDRATDAFTLLGNETRLAILLALWEAYEPFADDTWDPTGGNAVAFSDLRDRVGIRDSGQFNYHLGKLEGHFIEQTPEGYQLLPAGQKLVRTVIAGAGFEDPAFDPAEIDLACPHCGAPTAVTYQNQRVYQVCTTCEGSFDLREKHPENVLSAWMADPNVLHDRSAEAIYSAVNTEIYHEFAMRTGGLCPQCTGRLEHTLDVCQDHTPGDVTPCQSCGRQPMAVIRYVCTACKHTSVAAMNVLGWAHPAVGAFAWSHGIELGYGLRDMETASWLLDVDTDQELVGTDPLLVRITFRYEDDEIGLTIDENLDVIEVNENYPAR